MNSLMTVSPCLESPVNVSQFTRVPGSDTSPMLQAVLEGLDGILVLTEQREWIDANSTARHICRQLNRGQRLPQAVPEEIWRVCQCLIESWALFPDHKLILCDEIITSESLTLRIRARWLKLEQFERPCLLVTIEDHQQSIQNMAIAEAHKYGLTPCESRVWLLYRSSYSYKEIAAELYVTPNTVKKHMKSIHAKRKQVLGLEGYS